MIYDKTCHKTVLCKTKPRKQMRGFASDIMPEGKHPNLGFKPSDDLLVQSL